MYTHNHNALLFSIKVEWFVSKLYALWFFSTCLILYSVNECWNKYEKSNLKDNCFNDKRKRVMFVKKKIVRVIDFVIKVSVNLKEKNEK